MAGPFQERKGWGEIKAAVILIACLPGDTATFNVSKLTQMSGTSEPQSGNTGIFHSTSKRRQKVTLQLLQALQRLLSVLVIKKKEKEKRDGLSLTPSRFICDNASTEAGKI